MAAIAELALPEIIHLAPKLAKVFGAKDGQTAVQNIGKLVKSFDFGSINVQDKSRQDYLHTDLAPGFVGLTKDSIKMMDDKLKVMIAGCNIELTKLKPEERTWNKIISVFTECPVLEPMDGPENSVSRTDQLIKKGKEEFKFKRTEDKSVENEVHEWFKKLISDDDVMKTTKIDIQVVEDIVATTGAAVDGFVSVFAKSEHHEKTLVDIGVLRYPDVDHPFLKIYRIQLTCWSDCRRILFVEDDANGVNGTFDMRRFKPREAEIDGMRLEVRKKAIQEAEDMFA